MYNKSLFHAAMQLIICFICCLALVAVAVEAFPSQSNSPKNPPELSYTPTPSQKDTTENKQGIKNCPKKSQALLWMLYRMAAGGQFPGESSRPSLNTKTPDIPSQ